MVKRKDGTSTGRVFACRVSVGPDVVEELAMELGCLSIIGAGELTGACGVMLDRIAQGRLRVVPVDEEGA